MKASDLFVKALENEGVKYIFGVPGEENLDFLESLRTSSITPIITRHEQTAGFMAATFGRLTQKAGVCLSTLGPGATNLVTAGAYAQLGAMPMIMITGQKPVKKSKQGRFQIVNTVEMMEPLTKFSKQIINGDTIPSLVREAFRIAENERPGAVHLELPEDIASEDASTGLFEVTTPNRSSANASSLKQAAKMIQAAKAPLLLIGAGANRKETFTTLKDFIEKNQLYFFTTQMGKGVVDERNDLCLGTAALSDNDYIHAAINKADLIINVGHDIVEKPPFFMHRDGTQVIHMNFNPAHMDDVYFPNLEVIGDISESIYELSQLLNNMPAKDVALFKQIKNYFEDHVLALANESSFPYSAARIVQEVRNAMPENGIIALDNGMYKIWFARNYKAYQPNTILLDNALATMGAGLPSTMAAKMVHPDRKVMAICGDGGFMMNLQDLETAVRLKLDLTVLIIRDNAYGMIKWKQKNMGFADFSLDFTDPDFVKLAESFGAKGHRVTQDLDLASCLATSLNEPGVHLVEVPIDYSIGEESLGKELQETIAQLHLD